MLFFLLLYLTLFVRSAAKGDPLDNWASQQLATSNILSATAYGNGTYVIVGYNGEIWTSPDTSAWTKRPFSAGIKFLCMTFANGVFVASGSANGTHTSTDGINWTNTYNSVYTNNWNGISHANGKFVAVGDTQHVNTSLDGYSWGGEGGSSNGINIYGVTYGNGVYVVVCSSGTIWSSSSPPSTGLPSPSGGPSNIKGSGTTKDLLGVAFGNSTFVAVGLSGTITTSPDGTNWTVRSSGTASTLYAVTFANGFFVAVGEGGTIITSADGSTWASRASGTTNLLRGVTFVNNRFIAVGVNGTVTVSGAAASALGTVGNISTRSLIQDADNVMIAGIIIQGGSKKIIVRAIGPSLANFGITNALADPTLELHDTNNTIATNNDWQTTEIGGIITGSQVGEIQSSGFSPSSPKESAIIATLAPGNYTAIIKGVNGTMGVGLVEIYGVQ